MSASGVTYQVGVNFQTNTDRAIGGVTRFNSKLQQMAGAYAVARRQQQHLINGVSKLGDAARWSFTRLTLPLGIFGANLVKTHGQMESWRIAFRTVLRDVQKGDALMRRAVAFSVSTPFTTEAVVRRVQAHVGEEDEAPIEMLSRLGDIAAGVGRATDTGLTDMSRAYVKLLAKGRVDMESAEPFITAGAGVLRQAADMFYGGERERLYKAMERGEVKWTVMRDAIVAMTNEGGRFYKSMERQAKGILVSWAEVVSGFFVFRDALGEVIVKAYGLHGVLKSVTAWLLTSKDRIREWWGGASALTKSVVAVTGALALLSGPIFAVAAAISGLLVNFIVIGGAFVLWKKGVFSASGAAAGLAAVHGKAAAAGAALTGAATTAAVALRGVAASAALGGLRFADPTAALRAGTAMNAGKGFYAGIPFRRIGASATHPPTPTGMKYRMGAATAGINRMRAGALSSIGLTLGSGLLATDIKLKGLGMTALRAGAGLLRFLGPIGALTTGAWLLYEGVAKATTIFYDWSDGIDSDTKKRRKASGEEAQWDGNQFGIVLRKGKSRADIISEQLTSDAGMERRERERRNRLLGGTPATRQAAAMTNTALNFPGVILRGGKDTDDRLIKYYGHLPALAQRSLLDAVRADTGQDWTNNRGGKSYIKNPALESRLSRIHEDSTKEERIAALLGDVVAKAIAEARFVGPPSELAIAADPIREAVARGVADGWGEAFTTFINERNGLND